MDIYLESGMSGICAGSGCTMAHELLPHDIINIACMLERGAYVSQTLTAPIFPAGE